jgi:hypothetical protein
MKNRFHILTVVILITIISIACGFSRDIPEDSSSEADINRVLFQDDFSDNSGKWYTFVDDTGITDYENEGFRININEPGSYHWTNPELEFTDTRIEVEATKIGGPEENDFGIICRYQDENNFYFFTISSDGYYGIAKIIDGVESLVGMEELGFDATAINPAESTNLVGAECIGTTFTLYANGNKLVEVSDSGFASGDIGLIASTYEEPGTDILFDNLIVKLP